MIDYSNPILMSLRRVGQNFGILRPVVRMFRKVFNLSYESSFDQQMMTDISQNDIVWDIGANIGFFTKKFAEKVGINGQVYAFEPAQSSYLSLVNNCSAYENIFCKNIALSNKSGSLNFRDSGIDNDPTNGLVDDESPDAIKVMVVSGDELVTTKSVPTPNIVKIDVEGYEFEVIEGMKKILNNPVLKKIFVEVHFLELNKRGLETAVTDMVQIIIESEFSVKWTDPSHFIASRK